MNRLHMARWLAAVALLAVTGCAKLPTDPMAAPDTSAPGFRLGTAPGMGSERGADDRGADDRSSGLDTLGSESGPDADWEGLSYSDSLAVSLQPGHSGGDWTCGPAEVSCPENSIPDGVTLQVRVDRSKHVIDVQGVGAPVGELERELRIQYDLRNISSADHESYGFFVLDPARGYVRLPEDQVSLHGHKLRAEVRQFGHFRIMHESKAGWRGRPSETAE